MIKKPSFDRGFFLILKKNRIALLATILVVAAIFCIVNNPAVVGASATTRELPIYCVQRDNKVVSLTFDAAWADA